MAFKHLPNVANTTMPPLDNARHELFAQQVASGNSLTSAYEAAGYDGARQNASRLMLTNGDVQERVRELQAYHCDLTQITVASLVARADELRELAIEHKQISAGVAAVKEIGILTGLRIDRREIGAPGEFDRMNDEELANWIASENAKLIDIP